MRPHELFDLWAPPTGRWTPWAKPVLFLHVESPGQVEPLITEVDVSWAPRPGDGTAIVVDLPGDDSVACAVSLARRGYRPVPLYNTHANPAGALDLTPILTMMRVATLELPKLSLNPDSPPAFMLDANRLALKSTLKPLVYDNRWMAFPQDFPSAAFLQASGIRRVIVVQNLPGQPHEDLRHVLRRWQEASIAVLIKRPGDATAPESMEISRPSWFRATWHRWMAMTGLRRNSAGGFGSIIPEPSSGGSGFA